MKNNFGWKDPIILAGQYLFGSLPKIVLKSDGDWSAYLPQYEPQTLEDGEDEDGCSVWGTQNAIETIEKFLIGGEPNYSERFTYIMANVAPPGADPHAVAECIRQDGLVNQEDLPMTKTLAEFNTPKPMTVDLLIKGSQWLNKWAFGHEYVFTFGQGDRLSLIKEALSYSPLCVSVTAWFKDENGLYYSPTGMSNGHWCVLYKVSDKGFEIMDSYDQSLKTLRFDHDIQFCKRYSLTKPIPQGTYIAILKGVVKLLQDIISYMKNHANSIGKIIGFASKAPKSSDTKENSGNGIHTYFIKDHAY